MEGLYELTNALSNSMHRRHRASKTVQDYFVRILWNFHQLQNVFAFTYPGGTEGWVYLGGWVYAKMVYQVYRSLCMAMPTMMSAPSPFVGQSSQIKYALRMCGSVNLRRLSHFRSKSVWDLWKNTKSYNSIFHFIYSPIHVELPIYSAVPTFGVGINFSDVFNFAKFYSNPFSCLDIVVTVELGLQTKPPCDKTHLVRINPVQSKIPSFYYECRDSDRQINSSRCILCTSRRTQTHGVYTTV